MVVVAHIHGDATAAIDAVEEGVAGLIDVHQRGVGVALVLHQGATPPDAQPRKRMIRMMHEHRGKIGGFAVIMLGTGFWAAAARSVLTFLSVTSGMAVKVFAGEAPAGQWLVGQLAGSTSTDPIALGEALRALTKPQTRP